MRNLARAPMPLIARFYFVLMLSAAGVCQLPSSRCDEMAIALEDCPYLMQTLVAAHTSISTATNFADGVSESFPSRACTKATGISMGPRVVRILRVPVHRTGVCGYITVPRLLTGVCAQSHRQ